MTGGHDGYWLELDAWPDIGHGAMVTLPPPGAAAPPAAAAPASWSWSGLDADRATLTRGGIALFAIAAGTLAACAALDAAQRRDWVKAAIAGATAAVALAVTLKTLG